MLCQMCQKGFVRDHVDYRLPCKAMQVVPPGRPCRIDPFLLLPSGVRSHSPLIERPILS